MNRNSRASAALLAGAFGLSACAENVHLTYAPNAPPQALPGQTATELVKGRREEVGKGDCEQALSVAQLAFGQTRTPVDGALLAQVQADCGRLLEARALALQVTRIAGRDEPANWQRARDTAGKLSEELVPRTPTLTIRVRGPRGSTPVTITVDGREIPLSSAREGIKLNPGGHYVHVAAPGFQQEARKFALEEWRNAVLTLSLRREKSSTLLLLGLTGAGIGASVGAVAGVLSLKHTSSARERCVEDNCWRAAQSDIDRANTLAWVSNAGFGLAALGSAVAAYGYFSSRPSTEPRVDESVEIGYSLGPLSVGVVGKF